MTNSPHSNQINDDKKYIIKGSIINSLGLITNIIGPILVITLSRFFSQEEFGLFISLQLFVLTMSRIMCLGLDKGLLWFIPQQQLKQTSFSSTLFSSIHISFFFSLITFFISLIIIYSPIFSFLPSWKTLPKLVITICFLSIIPNTILNIGSRTLESLRKPQYRVMINDFLVTSLFPIFAIIFHFLNFKTLSLSIGFTFANCLGAALYILIFFFRFRPWKFSFKLPKILFNYSFPFVFLDTISSLLLRLDIWMVLLLLNAKEAAVYAIMVILSNGVKTIRQSFDGVILTIVSKMNRSTISKSLKIILSYNVNLVTSIQIIIALFTLFLPKEILMIAGKDYSVNIQALPILLIGNLLNGFFSQNSLILLGIGKSQLCTWFNVVTITCNTILNLIFIPHFGLIGAAFSSVLSYLLLNILTLISLKIITKTLFYQSHLWTNYILIVIFSIASLGKGFTTIQNTPLNQRILYLIACIGFCCFLFYLKREKFKIKYSNPS